MVNTINTLTERNKELLTKIDELERKHKDEISREAQLKIIDKIQEWKKENYETGDRLKKYERNTYPSHIVDNITEDRPLFKALAGHVNFELNMVKFLHLKENPLDELLEIMLNSITENVVGYYNLQGLKDKALEEKWKEKKKVELKEKEIKELEKNVSVNRKTIEKQKVENNKLEGELREKELLIKYLEEENIELRLGLEANLDAIKLQENWEIRKREGVENQLRENLELLQKERLRVTEQRTQKEETWGELLEKMKLLSKEREKVASQKVDNEELKRKLYLANKPLPSLPKKQNKFRWLGTKIKTKLQQVTKTAKKEKKQEQLMTAQIEIKK